MPGLRRKASHGPQRSNIREDTDMTDRIDRYFDGALKWTALTPEERAAAASIERAIHETRAFVDARPAPDLAPGVMRQIEPHRLRPATRRHRAWARFVGTLWTARRVSFQVRSDRFLFP